VVGYTPGATYYVRVAGAAEGTGNYFVGVDFRATATRLNTFAEGRLDSTRPSEEGRLRVTRAALFHFVLATDANDGTGVEMTITDSRGVVVGRLVVPSGSSASLTLTLSTGDYTVRVRAFRTDGRALTPVRYRLRGIALTDPVGPQPEDTTSQPSGGSGGSSGGSGSNWYTWSGSSGGGTGSEDPYGYGYTT
jgi:uncharacterized membrane protein YgcG